MPNDPSSTGAVFTPKETELLASCLKCLTAEVNKLIDFKKVAAECGYKDANNAKTMFYRLRKKKLGGDVGDEAVAVDGSDAPEAPAPKNTRRKRKTEDCGAKKDKKRNRRVQATLVDDGLDDDYVPETAPTEKKVHAVHGAMLEKEEEKVKAPLVKTANDGDEDEENINSKAVDLPDSGVVSEAQLIAQAALIQAGLDDA